jgi:hypothetical protein
LATDEADLERDEPVGALEDMGGFPLLNQSSLFQLGTYQFGFYVVLGLAAHQLDMRPRTGV